MERVERHFPVRHRPWSTVNYLSAVDGVSFRVLKGETFALVGESGSGKTTLGRMVLRLEKPDAGRVVFAGVDIHVMDRDELRTHRRRVQAVFQNPFSSLDPRMRIRRSMAEPLILSKKFTPEEIDARIKSMLERVGLDAGAADRLPHQFSGGQRQRIALARALAPSPELVVLDEPVSALDVSVRAQVMNLLKDVQHEHEISYILIAHELANVRYLAHRVAVMYLGRLVEIGPTGQVLTKSQHPYTRALISASGSDVDHSRPELLLKGEIPSAIDPPPGCPFHTRCWLYDRLGKPEQCTRDMPALEKVANEHAVACHFSEHVDSVGTFEAE